MALTGNFSLSIPSILGKYGGSVWEILTDRIKTTVGKTPHNQPLSRSTHDIFVLWSFGILFSGILAEQAIKKKDYRDSGLCRELYSASWWRNPSLATFVLLWRSLCPTASGSVIFRQRIGSLGLNNYYKVSLEVWFDLRRDFTHVLASWRSPYSPHHHYILKISDKIISENMWSNAKRYILFLLITCSFLSISIARPFPSLRTSLRRNSPANIFKRAQTSFVDPSCNSGTYSAIFASAREDADLVVSWLLSLS